MQKRKRKKNAFIELNNLKGLMRTKKVTYEEMAKKLGIGVNTFCHKINGQSSFEGPEYALIQQELDISPQDLGKYFFNM